MDKIAIVTVYNSPNCGSFLQAFAMNRVLERLGVKVFFLKTGARKFILGSLKNDLHFLIKRRFKRFSYDILKNIKYFMCQNKLNIVSTDKDITYVIFGSDEIWNVARDDFYRYPVFWGNGIKCRNKIAYAPSINNCPSDSPRLKEYVNKYLIDFNAIGLRDLYTYNVIDSFKISNNLQMVLDPSMLLSINEYKELAKKYAGVANKIQHKHYMAVYIYERSATEDVIKYVKELAAYLGVKTVAACTYLPWCDVCEPGSPFDFLEYFLKADYVITNTFHGTAFSINLNKRFGVLSANNTKVDELLKNFEACEHAFYLEKTSIEKAAEIISEDVDFDKINSIINSQRDESIAFLKQALNR